MTIKTVRNLIIRRLHDHIGRPVLLHDQTSSEESPPYLYYQLVSPLSPLGHPNTWYAANGIKYRDEATECTISITAVSYNRGAGNSFISGEDEALELAERAQNFFLCGGRTRMLLDGIAVVDVGNAQPRSNLMIDEVARQSGFDVRVRFVCTSTASAPGIASGAIISN